jgi:hypothetical protein
MRKRTIKLYRLADDGRKLLAGKLEAGSPVELVAKWQAFLAMAPQGVYVARYRGESLSTEISAEAAYAGLAA